MSLSIQKRQHWLNMFGEKRLSEPKENDKIVFCLNSNSKAYWAVFDVSEYIKHGHLTLCFSFVLIYEPKYCNIK